MNKEKAMLIALSVGTCGLGYLGYKLYKKGFDDGAKCVGDKLFHGKLHVEETNEDGKVVTKVVEPVLWPLGAEDYIDEFDEYGSVDIVHR